MQGPTALMPMMMSGASDGSQKSPPSVAAFGAAPGPATLSKSKAAPPKAPGTGSASSQPDGGGSAQGGAPGAGFSKAGEAPAMKASPPTMKSGAGVPYARGPPGPPPGAPPGGPPNVGFGSRPPGPPPGLPPAAGRTVESVLRAKGGYGAPHGDLNQHQGPPVKGGPAGVDPSGNVPPSELRAKGMPAPPLGAAGPPGKAAGPGDGMGTSPAPTSKSGFGYGSGGNVQLPGPPKHGLPRPPVPQGLPMQQPAVFATSKGASPAH